MTRARGFDVLCVLAFLVVHGPIHALAQTASVLDVVPEGAVIDAGQMPDLPLGARFGFRRPQADAKEIGQGEVLDIREGRALVGLPPRSSVQAGDLALRCASPESQANLRATVEQIKAQVPTISASAEMQTLLGELEATADARDVAIRDGACDAATFDQKISDVGAQIQQALATAPPPVSPPPAPSGSTESPSDVAVGAPPTGSGGGVESLTQLIDAVGRLVQAVQSSGLLPSTGSAAGGSPQSFGPPPQPADASTGSAPPPPPPLPAAGDITPLPSSPPPVATTPPPSSPSPAPGRPSDVVTVPAPGRPAAPPSVKPGPPSQIRPPGRETSPPVADPPVAGPTTRPGWWTVKPAPVAPVPGVATDAPAVSPKPTPGPIGQPIAPRPIASRPAVPVVQARPGLIRGQVFADADGRPGGERTLAGASVLVSDGRAGAPDHQVKTNANGVFAVVGLAAGRYTVMATAPGFRPASAVVSLSSGEIENVSLTLQRPALAPPRRVPSQTPQLQRPSQAP